MDSTPTRTQVIAEHKRSGGRIAAVFPVHYSRALFRAFNILPVEVWGGGRTGNAGDAHLQAYTCSVVRGVLSAHLTGMLRDAELYCVPHTCDSLQGLGSLFLDLVDPGRPVIPIYLPRDEGPAAVAFMASELRAIYDRLAELTGSRPSDADLQRAIDRECEADSVLAAMLELQGRLALPARAFYAAARSREYLPAEQFAAAGRRLLETTVRREEPAGVPILLSGIVPEPEEILDQLDAAGASIVADDMACCGRRNYAMSTNSDPFGRMAEQILGGPPDSTRGVAVERRLAHLLSLASARRVRAAVFYEVKFCEPEAFYLPQLRRGLEEAGIKTLALEVDISERPSHQIATRIEALLETLA
ncbi:MAG: 2-hydroxyacyl-CoA dehydratase [Candidatus Schekmanbacteria bacterium]|nr:2-hydroxyacyl-CoA dehydratase [Candidatus Schekmanbacteria bacterium]